MEKDLKRQTHVVYSVEEVLQQVEAARSSTESINHKIYLFTKNTRKLGSLRWDEDIELHGPGGLWDRIVAFITGVSPIEAGFRRLNLTDGEVRKLKGTLQNGGMLVVKEFYPVIDEMPVDVTMQSVVASDNSALQHNEPADNLKDFLSTSEAYENFVREHTNKGNADLIYDDRTGDVLDKTMLMDAEYADGFQTTEPIFVERARDMYVSDAMYDEAMRINYEYDAMRDLSARSGALSVEETMSYRDEDNVEVDTSLYDEAYEMNEAYDRERAATRIGDASQDISSIFVNEPMRAEDATIDEAHIEALHLDESMNEQRDLSIYSGGAYVDAPEEGYLAVGKLYESEVVQFIDDAMYEEAYAMNADFDVARAASLEDGDRQTDHYETSQQLAVVIDEATYNEAYAMNVAFDKERRKHWEHLHSMPDDEVKFYLGDDGDQEQLSNVTELPRASDEMKLWNENGDPLSVYAVEQSSHFISKAVKLTSDKSVYFTQPLMADADSGEPIPSELALAHEAKFIGDEKDFTFKKRRFVAQFDDPQLQHMYEGYFKKEKSLAFASALNEEVVTGSAEMQMDYEESQTYLVDEQSLEIAEQQDEIAHTDDASFTEDDSRTTYLTDLSDDKHNEMKA